MDWSLQSVQGDKGKFVLVSGEQFKTCTFNETKTSCSEQPIHLPAESDRRTTCRRLNACDSSSSQDKCCENELLTFISTGAHFIACGNNADYPKCFVFDEQMNRRRTLDFHSAMLRRGARKSWIDLWRSNEIFQMISLTVKPNRHLRLTKVNNYRNSDHTIIESGDLGVAHERDLKIIGAFDRHDARSCQWNKREDPACLTSLLYLDQQKRETYLTSICKNDPGSSSGEQQQWQYFERNKLKCCDTRFDQQDDYTCSSVATTAARHGQFVYVLFKPKMTLNNGTDTAFLCRFQLPQEEQCNFALARKQVVFGKTVTLDRLANVDRQIRLITAQQDDILLAQYKKGGKQGQLVWLQVFNGKIKTLGYYRSSPKSMIVGGNSTSTVLLDGNLTPNPAPECSMSTTGAAKFDCLACAHSGNQFCAGFNGNTCTAEHERNCDDIPIYRNYRTISRTGFILDGNRALLLAITLTTEHSQFLAKIERKNEVKFNWSDKRRAFGNTHTFDLAQELSETTNICNDEQSVYLTTWFTTSGTTLVSEEQFTIINDCDDLRNDGLSEPPPPPPRPFMSTKSTRMATTTMVTTASINSDVSDTTSSMNLSIETTPDLTTFLNKTTQPNNDMALVEANLLGISLSIIFLLVGIALGFGIGWCVARRKGHYSMGQRAH